MSDWPPDAPPSRASGTAERAAGGVTATASLLDRGERKSTRTARRLGDTLLEWGLLSADHLDWALEEQRKSGARLGEILLANGLVRRDQLYRALARAWNCDFVDLRRQALDLELARRVTPESLLEGGWFPYGLSGSTALVATSQQPTGELAHTITQQLQVEDLKLVATTDWDIADGVERAFGNELADDAANALVRQDPRLSARGGLSAAQIATAAVLMAALALGIVLDPVITLIAIAIAVNAIFTISVAFKLSVSAVGWRAVKHAPPGPHAESAGNDRDLPNYTILVPLYGESNVVSDLVAAMERIDYPRERLQILLLLEEEDSDTIAAARAALSPGNIRIVVVPDGQPRTKPRACNYGLALSHGEHVVIYDAEDRPEPDQLREAVAAFASAPEVVTCVQARLNYYNARENLLTRLFTLEYTYWFDYMLPGLDRLRLPIPLGGTSNHFRSNALRRAGAWDAFNVTEDADLGVRAHALGQRVGIISATTYEEAVNRVRSWIRQRTRWIKGYMQTSLVHSRSPRRMFTSLGVSGVFGFVMLVAGTPLAFLAAPFVWIFFGVWLADTAGASLPDLLPGILGWIGLATLVAGNVMLVLLHGLAVARRRLWDLAPFALLSPFYWMLHSYAAWRALFQLIRDPYRWEKTPHGVTDHVGPVAIERVQDLHAGIDGPEAVDDAPGG